MCYATGSQVIIKDRGGKTHALDYNENLETSKDVMEEILKTPHQEIITACPVDLEVYDSNGNLMISKNNVFYSGKDSDPEFVVIIEPEEESYTIKITGTEDGTYTLIVRSIKNGKVIDEKVEENHSILKGETQEKSVTLEIPETVDKKNNGSIWVFFLLGLILIGTVVISLVIKPKKDEEKHFKTKPQLNRKKQHSVIEKTQGKEAHPPILALQPQDQDSPPNQSSLTIETSKYWNCPSCGKNAPIEDTFCRMCYTRKPRVEEPKVAEML